MSVRTDLLHGRWVSGRYVEDYEKVPTILTGGRKLPVSLWIISVGRFEVVPVRIIRELRKVHFISQLYWPVVENSQWVLSFISVGRFEVYLVLSESYGKFFLCSYSFVLWAWWRYTVQQLHSLNLWPFVFISVVTVSYCSAVASLALLIIHWSVPNMNGST